MDVIALTHNRQLQSRCEHVVGQNVCVNDHFSSGDKMKPAWKGPFPILQAHSDGTVTAQRGQIHERVSVRRIKPG